MLLKKRYNEGVQRACAVVLLVVLSVSLIPIGQSAQADTNLPACCRRADKHGCSMKSMAAHGHEPSGAAFTNNPKCPFFPKAGATTGKGTAGAARLVQVAVDLGMKAILPVEQAHAQYRVSFSRGWQKRGPPSLLS